MFLTGVILQRFKIYQSNLIYGKGLYWLFIYLAFTYLVPTSQLQFFISMLLLAVCTLSIAYTAPRLGKYVLQGNDISYGVYMYHGLVLNIMVETNHLHHFRYLLFVLAASYLLGFLSWIGIEKRFLKKKHPAQLSNVIQPVT
jgi:peptidoglycan/LPS O-acetylase OafA/YrhL